MILGVLAIRALHGRRIPVEQLPAYVQRQEDGLQGVEAPVETAGRSRSGAELGATEECRSRIGLLLKESYEALTGCFCGFPGPRCVRSRHSRL